MARIAPSFHAWSRPAGTGQPEVRLRVKDACAFTPFRSSPASPRRWLVQRPASAGGQRWFHLYPGERIDYRALSQGIEAIRDRTLAAGGRYRAEPRPEGSRHRVNLVDIAIAPG